MNRGKNGPDDTYESAAIVRESQKSQGAPHGRAYPELADASESAICFLIPSSGHGLLKHAAKHSIWGFLCH